MSLTVVHLRWDDVGPEQYDELCRALPDGARRPVDCLLRQRRRQGRAVLGTEVWADGRSAEEFLTGLPDLLGPAGLPEPHRAVFAVPAFFAVGYGVPLSTTSTSRAAALPIPAPRVSPEATSSPVPTGGA